MIEKALEYLRSQFRPATVECASKQFILTADYKEIERALDLLILTRDESGDAMRLGTVESLINFLQAKATTSALPQQRRINVNRSGIVAVFDPAGNRSDEFFTDLLNFVKVPFIEPTKERTFDYERFKEFLDINTGKIAEEEELRSGIRSLGIIKKDEAKIEDRGPLTIITLKSGKGLEDAEVKLPKEIHITLPTGTREFEIEQRFIFRMYLDGPSFKLIKIENDGSWEKLLKLVIDKLTKALPNDLILEGV